MAKTPVCAESVGALDGQFNQQTLCYAIVKRQTES
jgi:hypothetical protein